MHTRHPSDRLGRYQIHGEVGKGGTGTVYRATDPDLERTVAVKVLSPELADDSTWLRRFKREARTASQLNHPNVVSLYSVEEDDGRHFITMEYLEGATLRSVMPADGYSLQEFLRIAIPIARALQAAHDAGITHRDLKPTNLFVTFKGEVKLLDFGIAQRDLEADDHTTVTQTAAFAGTAPYMSPEQIEGEAAGPASDLFSLGVLFYEMLVGERPFAGRTVGTVCAAILNDPPSKELRQRIDLPRALVEVIYSCLQRSPSRRPASAARVAELLEALRDEGTSTRTFGSLVFGRPPLQRAGRGWKVALAAGVLALAAFGLVRWGPFGAAAPTVEELPLEAAPSAFPLRLLVGSLADRSGGELPVSGISTALLDRLQGELGLEVIGHRQALDLETGVGHLVRVGRRMRADFFLIGELRQSGDDLARVELELIDLSTEQRLLLDPVQAPISDLFSVSRRLTVMVLQKVRGQTNLTARAHIARNATRSEAAYRSYQQAESLIHTEAIGDARVAQLETALDLYLRAADEDASFTDAWAQSALTALDLYRLRGEELRLEDALRYSDLALELDSDSPLANLSRGNYLRIVGAPADALPYFDRYVELAPAHAGSYASRASCRWQLREWQGALADIRRAVELAPHAHDEAAARYLFHMRQYAEAERWLAQALEDSPNDPEFVALQAEIMLHRTSDPARAREILFDMPGSLPEPLRYQTVFYFYLSRDFASAREHLSSMTSDAWELDLHFMPRALLEGLIAERLASGRGAQESFREAVDVLRAEVGSRGGDLRTLPVLAYALACAGETDEALDVAARAATLLEQAVDQNNAGYQGRQIAVALARAGALDRAEALVRRLLDRPAPLSRGVLRIDPDWDPLRRSPGFGAILEASGV